MSKSNAGEIKAQIVRQIRADQIRLTIHAHQEMVAENYSLDDVFAALGDCEMLENYPDHKRGACALFNARRGKDGRFILFAQPTVRC